MIVRIDQREPLLISQCQYLQKTQSLYQDLEIRVDNLPLGDISLEDKDGAVKCLVERKSVADLLTSLKDGRYEEQSFRLQGASGVPWHNVVYLLEGDIEKHGFGKPQRTQEKTTYYSALVSLLYFKGFSVLRSKSLEESALLLCHMAYKIGKGEAEGRVRASCTVAAYEEVATVKRVKRENVTPENMGVLMLSQIPGVGVATAKDILQPFGGSLVTLIEKMRENPDCLANMDLKHNERKISSSVLKKIVNYLFPE